jgi:hypothetical protein
MRNEIYRLSLACAFSSRGKPMRVRQEKKCACNNFGKFSVTPAANWLSWQGEIYLFFVCCCNFRQFSVTSNNFDIFCMFAKGWQLTRFD